MSDIYLDKKDYQVEEISYDEMMSILETQSDDENSSDTDSTTDMLATDNEPDNKDSESDKNNEPVESLAERVAKNANKQIPTWLSNKNRI